MSGGEIDLLEAPPGPGGWSFSSLLARLSKGRVVSINPSHEPVPRYGHGRRPHRRLTLLFEPRRDEYDRRLRWILGLREHLVRIPVEQPGQDDNSPYWTNGWLPTLDAAALYGILAAENPRRYVEIGSGMSTLFARRAIRDHGLQTRITWIDPQPRAEVDAVCDSAIRTPLQEASLDLFEDLAPGDILFVDGTHQAFMNSDVTVVFLDILPVLRPGVIVHFHDVWLPYDYPDRWKHWYYNEQYLLAAVLLAAPQRFEILLPCMFVSIHPQLSRVLDPLWDELGIVGYPTHGGSLWLKLTAEPAADANDAGPAARSNAAPGTSFGTPIQMTHNPVEIRTSSRLL